MLASTAMPWLALSLFRHIWILAYMAGALALIAAGTFVWLYLIVLVAEGATVLGGVVMTTFSFWFIVKFQAWVMWPWYSWFHLWKHFDDILDAGMNQREHEKRMRLVERFNRQPKP